MNNTFFWGWYQRPLVNMISDSGTLVYLFQRFTGFKDYHKEWRQHCLNFAYRVLMSDLCEVYWDNPDNLKILKELAINNPCNIDGYAVWSTYQFETTKKGESFLLECGVDKNTEAFSPLLKEKLSALFDEHGVGFDKSCFIPVVD